MYLQQADYKGRITIELLTLLIAEDAEDILAQASKIAEDAISTAVGTLYDITPEFSKTLLDRNYYILMLALNIATYEIYQRADDGDTPEKVIKNHDDALEDLREISKGKMKLNLPAVTTPSDCEQQQPQPCEPVPEVYRELPDEIHYNDERIKLQGFGLRRSGSLPRRSHTV